MVQPNYTWWPWQMLAAGVGLVSGLIVAGSLAVPTYRREVQALGIVLSFFAGGNALILGTAIGDLGRTIQALLTSVAIASLFSFLPVEFGLLAPLVIVPTITMALSLERHVGAFCASAYLGLKALAVGTLAYLTAMIAILWLWSLVTRGGRPELLALPVGCALGNAFMIGYLFSAARRVRTESSRDESEENT